MDHKQEKKIIPLGVTIGGYTFGEPVVNSDFTTLEGVVDMVILAFNALVGLSALVAVGMIVFAAFTFITAGGDPDKIKKGSDALTAAVVGMAIVFLARTIILFILENLLS